MFEGLSTSSWARAPFWLLLWLSPFMAIKACHDIQYRKFFLDVQTANVPGIEWDLDHGHADSNAMSANGWTPLMMGAVGGHEEVVRILLTHGANVNATRVTGSTALIEAVLYGHADIVRLLLEQGASVNAQCANGVTALMIAVGTGRADLVKLLLAAGADPHAKTGDSKTVADFVCRGYADATHPCAKSDILDLLLKD